MICAELALIIGIYTTHFDPNTNLNEDNDILGVQCDDWAYVRFMNSYRQTSYSVMYDFKINDHVGIYAGYVHGYDKEILPVPLNALAYIDIGPLSFGFSPAIVGTVSWKFEF